MTSTTLHTWRVRLVEDLTVEQAERLTAVAEGLFEGVELAEGWLSYAGGAAEVAQFAGSVLAWNLGTHVNIVSATGRERCVAWLGEVACV
jgi:predicted Zn-dependent protease with MMP-like domain